MFRKHYVAAFLENLFRARMSFWPLDARSPQVSHAGFRTKRVMLTAATPGLVLFAVIASICFACVRSSAEEEKSKTTKVASLEGTKWAVKNPWFPEDTFDWYEFRAGGRVRSTYQGESRESGTWKQTGESVVIRFKTETGEAEYKGTIGTDRIEGEARNDAGKSWKWSATKAVARAATESKASTVQSEAALAHQRAPNAAGGIEVSYDRDPARPFGVGGDTARSATAKEGDAKIGKAVAVDLHTDPLLVEVEETHYSKAGAVTYKGRLYFDLMGQIRKETAVEGKKERQVFTSWPVM